MSDKTDRIKKHFRDNKKTYIVVGVTAAVSVAVTVVVMKTKCPAPIVVEHAELAQNVNQVAVGFGNNLTVVNFIERSTPSKPVHLKGTNQYFASIKEAARATGHTAQDISQNARGLKESLNGDVFEFLEKVAA